MNSTLLAGGLALLAGLVIPLQAVINSRLGNHIGGPLPAALVNFFVGFCVLFASCLVSRLSLPSTGQIAQTSWWMYVGGMMGAFLVFSSAFAVPKLGATLLIALIVGGQQLTSVAIDHFGVLGAPEIPLNWQRAVGVILLIAGVLLIQRSG